MNFSGVKIDMSFKEARDLEALLERDKAKAVIEYHYSYKLHDGSTPKPSYLCPSCKEPITFARGNFCPFCGQRLDRENVAL